jgi:predicted Na+-dependent transporter
MINRNETWTLIPVIPEELVVKILRLLLAPFLTCKFLSICVSPLVNKNKSVLKLTSDGQPYATVLCQFTEYSYNLPKLGELHNTESDTNTDTN